MAVHTLHIESAAAQTRLELQSAATWVRGPGRSLRFRGPGAAAAGVELEVDDRTLRFGSTTGGGPLFLEIQIATVADRVTLVAHTSGGARITIRRDPSGAACATATGEAGPQSIVLFLDGVGAMEAGAGTAPPRAPLL